jgi:hypothetical protein
VNEIVDSHHKTILSLVWLLVQYHWRRTAASEQMRGVDVKLAEVLRDWCLYATQKCAFCAFTQFITSISSFPEVVIKDFTSSWRDGYAINAVINFYR